MKNLIILFVVAALFGCNPKDKKPDTVKVEVGIKNTSEVLTPSEIEQIEGNLNFVSDPSLAKGQRKKVPRTINVKAALSTLTHNSGNSFTINYNGQTNIVWTFHRCGNEQSPSSGNVIPVTVGPSFYLDIQPVRTYDSWCSGLFYQVVTVTGTTTPDENGVVGADWVMTYSNAVN